MPRHSFIRWQETVATLARIGQARHKQSKPAVGANGTKQEKFHVTIN